MRNKLIVLVLTLISINVNGQKLDLNSGGTKAKNYYIELPYEKDCKILIVPIEVNGVKRRFMFDTGAPTVIYGDLIKEMNHDEIIEDLVTDSQGQKDSLNFSTIDEIAIGGVIFEKIPVILSQGDVLMECFNLDGVIGSNLLRNSIVQFDSERNTIIITDQKKKLNLKRENAIKLKLNEQSNPYISIEINNKANELILFDSGANNFFEICTNTYNNLINNNIIRESKKGFGGSSLGIFGFEQLTEKVKVKIESIKIGNNSIEDFWVMTNSGGNSAIGIKLFKYGKVTVDYKHAKFYFEPKSKDQKANEKNWPISPFFNNGKTLVAFVMDEISNKVEIGDEITEIDGQAIEYNDLCDFITSHIKINKDEAVFTIKRKDGTIKKLTLIKE